MTAGWAGVVMMNHTAMHSTTTTVGALSANLSKPFDAPVADSRHNLCTVIVQPVLPGIMLRLCRHLLLDLFL